MTHSLLARLRVVFAEKGNYRAALRETMHEVGIPMTVVTFALIVAFGSYLISELDVLTSFGTLLCASVFLAWIIEIMLTPTLMVLFKPFGPETVADADSEASPSGAAAQPA